MEPETSETRGEERRLLLLEFVTHERWVYDGRFFPHFKGAAAELGIEARWLCFGARITLEKTAARQVAQYMAPTPEELALIARHVAELGPTHVITSHPVSAETMACLKGGGDGVEVQLLTTTDLECTDGTKALRDLVLELPVEVPEPKGALNLGLGTIRWREGRTDWLLRWLGETPETCDRFGRYLVGEFEPRYDALMANEAARAFEPNLIIMGGVSCDHFARISENAHYDGLSDAAWEHDFGCGYCTWYRGPSSELNVDPVGIAAGQLRALAATGIADGRYCGRLEMQDIRLLRRIDRFFDVVLELDLPPTVFLFEPRIDRFLEVVDELEAVLPRLAEVGHRISLLRMGAETLVEEENVLYNKDVSLAQIDEASARLRALAAEHPDTFDYDPTWGYITCSPWTTLEMFETGIRRAIERGLEPLGVWLYTPLLLYKTAPITTLAEAEGDIITGEFDDVSMLYEAAINQVPFDSMTGWRFKDARTGVAFALIVRFCAAALRHKYPDTVFAGDELYAHLLEEAARLGPLTRPDLFALEAIARVRASMPPYDAEVRRGLMDGALARYERVMEAVAPDPRPRAAEGQGKAQAAAPSDFARAAAEAIEGGANALERESGLRPMASTPDGEGLRVELVGDAGEQRLTLTVVPAVGGVQRAFRRGRTCALMHDVATPPDSKEKERAVELVVALVDGGGDAGASSGASEDKLRFLLDAVGERLGARLGGLEVRGLRARGDGGLALELASGGRVLRLRLDPVEPGSGRALLRGRYYALSHAGDAEGPGRDELRGVALLIKAFERAVERYAPRLLPGGGA